MNSSSSFDFSVETMEKSFKEYDTSSEDFEACCLTICKNSEIENPVKKNINKLARLFVDADLSLNTIQKMIPVINETPDASIIIPENKAFFQNNIKKSFEARFYVNCQKCKEIGEIGIFKKYQAITKKDKDNYFVNLQI